MVNYSVAVAMGRHLQDVRADNLGQQN